MRISPATNTATIAITLFLFTMSPPPLIADDQVLKIGVLVPDAVFRNPINEQIEAGAEISADILSYKGDPQIKVEFVHGRFDKLAQTHDAYIKLRKKWVSVIVVGMSPKSAAALRNIMRKSTTPTILFDDEGRKNNTGVSDNILDLGLPVSVAYGINLEHWIKQKHIKTISVFYGGDNRLTFKYGARVTSKVLERVGTIRKFSDISLYGNIARDRDKKFIAIKVGVKEIVPDGIIMSARYQDKVNLMPAFGEAISGTPIFIAPPVASVVEITELIKRAKNTLYFSTQFWRDLKEKTARRFVGQLREKLK